jgi:Holliday junction DNA helicase RuvB
MKTVKNEREGVQNALDYFLRPKSWDEFIGQDQVKEALKVLIAASKKRGVSCDHILFSGPSGLGKTTLAYLIAHELSNKITVTTGPAIKKTGDLAALLTNLEDGEILFIDEAHRLNRQLEEILYPAMESRVLHLMVGKGVSARSLELKLPAFTLIAATTRPSLLSNPLRSRFGSLNRLDFYPDREIERILQRSAQILSIPLEPAALSILACASRATPRTANRLLKRTWDLAVVKNRSTITESTVRDALRLLGLDPLGLDRLDREFLEALTYKFHGGPTGIQTLAAAVNEDVDTLAELVEPFLMRLGFVERTPKGRASTTRARTYLKQNPSV